MCVCIWQFDDIFETTVRVGIEDTYCALSAFTAFCVRVCVCVWGGGVGVCGGVWGVWGCVYGCVGVCVCVASQPRISL